MELPQPEANYSTSAPIDLMADLVTIELTDDGRMAITANAKDRRIIVLTTSAYIANGVLHAEAALTSERSPWG